MTVNNTETILATCKYIIATQNGILPINPLYTISKNGWELFKYSTLAKDHNISVDCVSRLLGTDEAACFCNKNTNSLCENKIFIAYNDLHSPQDVRVALAHEIGHIARQHFAFSDIPKLNFSTNSISCRKTSIPLETDADIFSSNFIAPAPLFEIYNMGIDDIQRIFCISQKAAEYRLAYAKEDAKKIDPYIKQIIKDRFADSLRQSIFIGYN